MQVAKWGNQLGHSGCRRSVVETLKLKAGDEIEITVSGIAPASRLRGTAVAKGALASLRKFRGRRCLPGSNSIPATRPMSASDAFFDTAISCFTSCPRRSTPKRIASSSFSTPAASSAFKFSTNLPPWQHASLRCRLAEIKEILSTIRAVCTVKSLDLETHEAGPRLAERYRYSIYDSMITRAALRAVVRRCFPKTFRHGQKIDRLTIDRSFQKRERVPSVPPVE